MDRGRLICAIADDDHAFDVIETGHAIALAAGLERHYVTVAEVEPLPSPAAVPAASGVAWAPFPEGSYHAAERRAAARAAEFLTGMGLAERSVQVCTGGAASELHDVARSTGAAAIVVGSSSTGAIGSVARWLAVSGSRPVVFARSAGNALEMAGPVVCGVDIDDGSAERVAATGERFAALLGRELVPVHVEDGREAERLATHARDRGASLLVVGNRGRGPIRSTLGGSVSLDLARDAHPPVVVVPPNG